MAISRMQQPRQQYGLGKLVKKAFKGLKKVAKSPLGRAAILGGIGMHGMGAGPFSKMAGQGWMRNMMSGLGTKGAGKFLFSPVQGSGKGGFFKTGLGRFLNPWSGGKFNPKHAFGLGAAGLIAAPFIQKAMGYGPYEDVEEEVDDWTITPSSIANIRAQAADQDPSLAFLPASNYVQSGFYAADGGRAHRKGFFEGALADTAEGQPMSPGTSASGGTHEGGYGRADVPLGGEHGTVILTDPDSPQIILNEPELTGFQKFQNWIGRRGDEEVVDENAAIIPTSGYESLAGDLGNQRVAEKAAADIWKEYNTGGRVGLLNGGGAAEAQMEQMLRAEYMKYRNRGGTMPYEQFKILVMKQSQQGQMPNQMMAANGGRAGYAFGEEVEQETDFIHGPQGNEEFSETVVEEVGATDEQKAMVHDMLQRGMDHPTIAAVTGLDEATVLSIIQEAQAMAQGGRAGFKWGSSAVINTQPLETYNIDEIQDIEKEIGVGPMADWDDVTPLELESLELLREEFRNDNNGQEPRSIQELMKFMFEKHGPSGVAEVEDALAEGREMAAQGGRMGFQMGGDDDEDITYNPYRAMDMYKRTRRQEGGLMDLGGQEKDYRDEGGFVALGGEERADDVPARLSKNEFVFTADAVRNAGGGDIGRGSEVMQNMMDNLEAGGEISEESQGLEGGEEIMSEEIIDESNPAQGMYDNYEQLQTRVV